MKLNKEGEAGDRGSRRPSPSHTGKVPSSLSPSPRMPSSRQAAISDTKSLLTEAIKKNGDFLIQPPPTIHPERFLPEIVANHDVTVTYLTLSRSRRERMVRRCTQRGLSVQHITSNKEACESYNGTHGEEYADRIKTLYEDQNTSLGHLHETGDLRCQPGCPFTSKSSHKQQQSDMFVGPPVIAYMDMVRDDRTVIVQGITGDEYVTTIESPAKQLSSYLTNETKFSGYSEFIQRRGLALENYTRCLLRPDRLDIERAVEAEGHVLAPLATFGISNMEELNNDWETTYYYRRFGDYGRPMNRYSGPVDRWAVANCDYDRHRVVRNPGKQPEGDTLHVLRVPEFSTTNGVVGLDVAPNMEMWRTSYSENLTRRRVFEPRQTSSFLRKTMDISIVQTADSYKPYDGRAVTPGRDVSVTLWANAEFGSKPILISTKNALTEIYPDKVPELLDRDVSAPRQYRGDDRPIAQQSPVIVAHGAPRPPNSVFQMWGAFRGESVPATSNSNNSFGEVGDKIRRQLMHSRVGQAVANLGENGRGATIVLNTTAVPRWLRPTSSSNIDPTTILPENAHAKRKVARYLRACAHNGESATIDEVVDKEGVSESTVRDAMDIFTTEDWVTKHSTGRFPTEYEWVS